LCKQTGRGGYKKRVEKVKSKKGVRRSAKGLKRQKAGGTPGDQVGNHQNLEIEGGNRVKIRQGQDRREEIEQSITLPNEEGTAGEKEIKKKTSKRPKRQKNTSDIEKTQSKKDRGQ